MTLENFKWYYMNFSGRVDRKTYWLFYFLPMIFFGISMDLILNNVVEKYGLLAAIAFSLPMIPILCAMACGYVKRQHDLGRSGWWILIGAVPLIGAIYNVIYLGCFRGSDETNKYGEPVVAPKGVINA